LHRPFTGDELLALRERLRENGVASWAEELVREALVTAPVAADPRERSHDFLTRSEPPVPVAPPCADAIESLTGPSPPAGEEGIAFQADEDVIEVTPEDLVQDLAIRLSALNQDLAMAVEAWKDLPPDGRKLVVEQARYVSALLPFMEAEE
jgi:hypothetical protein